MWLSWANACSNSVDFPMPGSPPISTTPPGTKPPPSTRSNSSLPVEILGTSRACRSESLTACALGARATGVWPLRETACARTSSSVFHEPQPSHWPCHFALAWPHSRHTNCDLSLAIHHSLGHTGRDLGHQFIADGLGALGDIVHRHMIAPAFDGRAHTRSRMIR